MDTSFLVARFSARDRNHGRARAFLEAQGSAADPPRLVLSDYVFDETVTTLRFRSRRHDVAVRAGAAMRDSRILSRLEADRAAFDAAWELFRDRPDKAWSFTDCTSFVLMERLGIRKALAFDRNFLEAGFAALP